MTEKSGDRYVPRELLLEEPDEFGRKFHAKRTAKPELHRGPYATLDGEAAARRAALKHAQWLAANQQHQLSVLVRDYLEHKARNRGAQQLALDVGRQYDWLSRVLNGAKVMQWHDAEMLRMRMREDSAYAYLDRLRFFMETSSLSR